MPEYEFNKPHHLNRLHDELIADGITPEAVRGQPDGDIFWITVPAALEAQVQSVVDAHDGPAAKEAAEWVTVRVDRNERLRVCDWTVLGDSQIVDSNKVLWLTYRQTLRDIPQVQADPTDITWPTAPTL